MQNRKERMHKFRAQGESTMLHVRGHKSRQLVHVEVHKLNLNTVINLEYLVSFYMNIHFILKMHINLSRQMKSYGIPRWMKSKATIFKKKSFSRVTNYFYCKVC